jgi:hypothetical protein
MKFILPLFIAGSLALGGGGVAVAALNLHTGSPRLLGVAIAAAVLGILFGAFGLRRLRS